jgi:hypothetical protein
MSPSIHDDEYGAQKKSLQQEISYSGCAIVNIW